MPDPGGAGGVGVTISAPGEQQENISRRCRITSSGILSTRLDGGTVRMAGTSMATPHVTGVVALLAQQEGLALTPEEARRSIRQSAARSSQAPLDSPAVGYSFDGQREGILSAPRALGSLAD